ncbi:MAG: hypothetical protein K0R88_604 [Solirubrobacterales bacterium]|jgi:hypothetical protein|nr:hypothetical protein [Solirubrobacterales bacterium]
MRRWGILVAGVAVFVVVASQILVPSLGERRVEDRLTERGGSAEVTLGAFPAVRLLFSDGERFEVEARDLDLALDQEARVFDRLDGFSLVEVSIEDSVAGPFELDSFRLSREGGGPYRLVSSGVTTVSGLVDAGFETVELPGESLADLILNQLFGEADDAEVPVELDAELTSEDGRVRVVSGGGTVAGFETGPLAELISSAIVVQL